MAKPDNKVIITCAITGAIHTPTLSDALPYRPADIAQQAIDAARAGAAILHLHARNPADGSPTGDPEVFNQFLPRIHAETDAVINLTTGGSPEMTVEQRLAAALRFRPEMCSLNMGSMNFSFHGMTGKVQEWKFPWEKKYILDSEGFIFRNTFRDIARVYEIMSDFGTRYEHECYDIGHLYNLAHFLTASWQAAAFHSERSASSAASAPTRTTSCSCGARPTGCSARITSGRCWPPGGTRCR
jgi:uncharacterized protein (DUF849 family)